MKVAKNRKMKEKSRKRSKAEAEDSTPPMDEEPKSKKRKSAVAEHKATLEKLQKTDPKFYEFLKEQDAELLDFDVSDAEDEEDGMGGERENEDEEEMEEPEDEQEERFMGEEDEGSYSDDEDGQADKDDDEGPESSKVSVTAKLVRQWQSQLSKIMDSPDKPDATKIMNLLEQIVDAFRAVVAQAGGRPDKRGQYRIDDSSGFNAVVRLCFSAFPAIWQRMAGADFASISQGRQKRLRPYVKPYLRNLIEFLQEIQNADVLNAVLKHVTHVADYYSLFGTLSRQIVKALVKIWSTKDESARVLAFISIMKLVRGSPEQLGAIVLKKMYLAYVQNTKLVTPTSWPLLSFMQKSYAEVCGLDKQLSYQHAFIYIRQLAIHLRNAITTKKKDQIMAVYNWQFVQCLYLWARVLATHAKSEILQPLVYPLIQIALGCARLIPTPKYFPLRFHCIRAVLTVAQEAGVFAPVLPVVLEILQQVDFRKKHLRQSLKPLDFDCLLKLSQSQLQESAFKTGVVESTLELIVEAMNVHAGSVAFPELAFICCSRLKAFYKSCHIAALSRPAKELSDKFMEHSAWLERHRAATALNLADVDGSTDAFEMEMAGAEDSPLKKYYETFKLMKERERKLKLETALEGKEKEPPEMEDEEEKVSKQRPKEKKASKIKTEKGKGKEKLKKKAEAKRKTESKKMLDEDVVQDLNLSDLDE